MWNETYLVGTGRLAERLGQALPEASRSPVPPSLEGLAAGSGPTLVILASDGSALARDLAVQRRCLAAGAEILHARLVRHLGFVGPWVVPDRPGCLGCAERWRAAVLRQTGPDHRPEAVSTFVQWLPWLDQLATVVAATVRGDLDEPIHEGGRVYALRGVDLLGRLHHFVPEPTCPDCAAAVPDRAALAPVTLIPRIQRDPTRFRVERHPPGLAALREAVVDWRYGPVLNVFRNERSPFSLTAAEIARLNGSEREGGFGRTGTYPSSQLIGLLEAIERIGSAMPTARRTVVVGSYAELGEDALDPASLGLQEDSCYAHPDCLLVPYTPDARTRWVWGYSLRRRRPVLVPEHVAFYDVVAKGGRDPHRFLYESSNGCATGGCLEEAILYALLEVIERDAFLMTWYRQIPVREVALDDGDPQLGHLADRLAAHRYTLHALDAPNEFGVPAIISAAVRVDDDGPKAFLAAGAHPDPRRAIRSAVAEVATNAVLYPDQYPRHELLAMLREPERVKVLDDHVALYTLPEAFGRMRFLFPSGRPVLSVAEAYPDWQRRWIHQDLTVVLDRLLRRVYELDMDVIVVDQTPPEPLGCGLRTVKALVPGTIPMTFGHVHRRTRNLPRLTASSGPGTAPAHFDPHPFP
jgi:ribosomal protein S12 methylthiotransferase accessory factor